MPGGFPSSDVVWCKVQRFGTYYKVRKDEIERKADATAKASAQRADVNGSRLRIIDYETYWKKVIAATTFTTNTSPKAMSPVMVGN